MRLAWQSLLLFTSVTTVAAQSTATPLSEAQSNRYGPLGTFDARSDYGRGIFPEPFLVDDTDLEVNEARFDWIHQERRGEVDNLVTAELEKGFGLATIEVAGHYEFDEAAADGLRERAQGSGNVDVGIRFPVWQYVSDDLNFDTTFGVGFELGIPTNSPISKNTELVPKFFNDTRFGDHLTLQTLLGWSKLLGSGEEGGSETFEYGLVLGYSIDHNELPLPDVQTLIPVVELAGETALNHDVAGRNTLIGDAGFRVNLNPVGAVQPRLGIVYIFPVDKGGRDAVRWGIATSLVFDF